MGGQARLPSLCCSTDAGGANAVLAAFKEALGKTHEISVSKGAISFLPKGASDVPAPWERVFGVGAECPGRIGANCEHAALPPPAVPSVALQLVRCLYRDPSQVLQSFDLAPCKVLARFESPEGPLRVEALPSCVESLRRKAFWVDTAVWGTASPSRILKYIAKGFEAAIPGVRRVSAVLQQCCRPPRGS